MLFLARSRSRTCAIQRVASALATRAFAEATPFLPCLTCALAARTAAFDRVEVVLVSVPPDPREDFPGLHAVAFLEVDLLDHTGHVVRTEVDLEGRCDRALEGQDKFARRDRRLTGGLRRACT